jgi:putative NIF3 family GTP cyclohydrolase 1 type 2
LNTREIMQVGLDLGGFDDVPADSGIWVAGEDIQRVLVGIDVGTAELKIAKDLGFDAVVAHHPVRRRGFSQIFLRHWELMRQAGVPDEAIRAAIEERAMGMRLSEGNHNDDHVVSVARLLAMPFLNIHLPLDEYGRRTIVQAVAQVQQDDPRITAGQVATAIGQLPSFQRSPAKPLVVYGSADAPAGRVAVSIASGTNGGHAVASAYFNHGVDTVIYMHVAPEDLARLRDSGVRGNLIITGHMAGDSIGIDAFVGELRRRHLEVTTFSGVDTPLQA